MEGVRGERAEAESHASYSLSTFSGQGIPVLYSGVCLLALFLERNPVRWVEAQSPALTDLPHQKGLI